MTATGARSNTTCSPFSGPSHSADCDTTIPKRSTSTSSVRPTTAPVSPPRPSTRSTSSSAAPRGDAVRRGLVSRNVALVAHAPRLRSIPKVEQQAWTAEELQAFLRAAAGHRFFPALWVAAFTGTRRNELLGLRWPDFDAAKATLSINRGLVAIAYEVHQTRGKTPNARRGIDLDPTTMRILTAWRAWQQTEQQAAGIDTAEWMFTDGSGEPIHPHAISQAFNRLTASREKTREKRR